MKSDLQRLQMYPMARGARAKVDTITLPPDVISALQDMLSIPYFKEPIAFTAERALDHCYRDCLHPTSTRIEGIGMPGEQVVDRLL